MSMKNEKQQPMKLMNSVEIDKPLMEVLELFTDRHNRRHWMEGFVSSNLLSGEEGRTGAKSKINFIVGKRRVEMTETIILNSLPDEYTCTYETKGIVNKVKCMFAETTNETTDFCTVQEFEFKGFMKVVGFLMPGVFKKQAIKYLEDFKRFAERA
jgi:uncharacterized membrane protein